MELAQELGGDLTNPVYVEQLETGKRLLGAEGFTKLLADHDLDALVFSDAWASFGAVPGYPSISIPAGYDDTGHPVPIEFLANPYSEPTLIAMAYAYEQGTQMRRPPSSAPPIPGDFIGPGDFDGSGGIGADDIDQIISAVLSGENAADFDLTGDGLVDSSDVRDLVTSPDMLNSYFGDANLDGQFDTADLVHVFQFAEYEDGLPSNSTWGSGDWNGDGEFNSNDLMFAFQEGGYRIGRRLASSPQPANVVPEPTGLWLIFPAGVVLRRLTQRSSSALRRRDTFLRTR